MSLKKNRRAGDGWVRDRKKFGAGPPVKYSFSEEESPQDSETGRDTEPGDVLQQEEPKDIPADEDWTEPEDDAWEEPGDDVWEEPGDADAAGAGEDPDDIPVDEDRTEPEDDAWAVSGDTDAADAGEDPDDIPAGREPEDPDEIEIQMPDPEEDILQSAFPDRQGSENGLIRPQDSGDVPAVQEEAGDAAEEDSRLKKFMTRDRVEKIHLVIRTVTAGFFAFLFLMPIVLTTPITA